MSGVVRKKQDDKYLTALRELVNTGGGNRQCFDCGQKGPTYVNMTIGSFVCTRCSGVLRGLTPPQRVKSISMATFTQDEIGFLKAHGNDDCAKTWLGLWDPKRAVHQDHRELMIDKYERKRYYLEPASPLKSLTNAASLKATASQSTGQTNGNQTTLSNGHKSLNGNNSSLDNGFSSIQLTPPTSQRTTSNGLHHKSSSSAISRPQLQQNGGHTFNHHQDAFMLNNNNNNNNNGNGLQHHHGYSASAGSTSTGALSDTSSCASNGFGPEADFVADFGSANIFDATSASSVGSPAVSSASSVASSNGYAKIQPIKAAHQQHQFMNGHANGQLNGTSSTVNGNTENFADFDHAPIYNAAANYQFISKSNLNKTATNTQQVKQQKQRQPNQQFPTTAAATTFPKKSSNDVDFITDRFNDYNNDDDDDHDVIGTLAAIIGNGNNRNGMPSKTRNIIYTESTSNFNDPFSDFENVVNNNNSNNNNNTNNNTNSNKSSNDYRRSSSGSSIRSNIYSNRNNKSKFVTFESDFVVNAAPIQSQQQQQQQQHQLIQQQQQHRTSLTSNSLSSTKFTPLAMAAHATAMAVLGSDYHFNKYNSNNNTNNTSYNNNNSESRIKFDNNINKNVNTYRNPFDTEQWDVWQESNILDDNNKRAVNNNDSWATIVPSNTDNDDDNNSSTTNISTNNSHYIALSEFTTAAPVSMNSNATSNPAVSTNWFNSNNSSNSFYSTPTPTTVAVTETTVAYNTMSNILTPATMNATNYNCESSKTQSMSVSFCNQSNNVVHQPTMLRSSLPSSSLSLSLSSYPSTNPFRTNFLQETFTNCDNSCKIANTTTTTTNTTTTTTSNTSSTTVSITSTAMPLEVFARPDITFCDPSYYHATSSNPIVANANFNSDYDSNRVSSGGWRAIPIPNRNHKNSLSSSNNNNLSSTPSEDRYAALKDLDEQLRESKAVAAAAASVVGSAVLESFGNNNNNLSIQNGNSVNPFKSQQQNPFQMATANNAQHLQQQNLYGQLTVIPNGISGSAPTTNGFGAQQTPPQPTAFFNYSNGFTSASLQGGMSAGQTAFPTMASGPSGCGFGFGAMQQQMSATGVGTVNGVGSVGAYVNPFAAAGALNTNNPFL